ncbi:MAG: ribosomal protein S18-alanine N-acetyltransferase [Ectothiorhodospiraceae bacterium]|nr:ribosomal protein S18-alanine N-acetyltransferase [Ectothiorhodospiraceae bacterium]MCH8504370.1 ribosomal protein S18-alanine N-acetyltransferase [Ectothiorhodospiraceae bacterium]
MSAVLSPGEHVIRRMRDNDLPWVLRVERASYDFPWTEGVFRDCLRVGYGCWVLHDARSIAGHLILSVVAGEAHVLNLCVHPDQQGRGLGAQLLEYGLSAASRLGAEMVFLEVRPSNQVAVRLYERAGFGEVGLRKSYYPAPGGAREDALILARALLPDND